ncbi:hypothetical protein F4804DRAFT_336249 [Jackrogersella minutella]|nr:hypothetical protein F4804DRAFT_336249 [Jackrogersella minutella]
MAASSVYSRLMTVSLFIFLIIAIASAHPTHPGHFNLTGLPHHNSTHHGCGCTAGFHRPGHHGNHSTGVHHPSHHGNHSIGFVGQEHNMTIAEVDGPSFKKGGSTVPVSEGTAVNEFLVEKIILTLLVSITLVVVMTTL